MTLSSHWLFNTRSFLGIKAVYEELKRERKENSEEMEEAETTTYSLSGEERRWNNKYLYPAKNI